MSARRRHDARRDAAELDRVGDMLRARIFGLVREVWGLDGWREGHDWVCRNPLRNDRTPKSFRIAVSGPRQGMVKDFAGPFLDGKDCVSALSFHAALMQGGDMGAAVRWAKAWLGLDGADPVALRQTQRAIQAFDDRPDQDDAAAARRLAAAKRIYFFDVVEDIAGTPAAAYLAGRGIRLSALGWPVRALRWKPACPLGKDARRPAMVAPIVRPEGGKDAFVGVHRTFLEAHGAGWRKAGDLADAKRSLGFYAGGAIRLWNGVVFDPETGELRYGKRLSAVREPVEVDLAEGIEDGLSVAVACPEARVWCGVSLSNMTGLVLPDQVQALRFWRQNDAAGSAAARQFDRAVDNAFRQGRKVSVVEIPAAWKDANEVLQAQSAGAGSLAAVG